MLKENGSELISKFNQTKDTLWVYKDTELIFRSEKRRLEPLLEYIEAFTPQVSKVTIFDRLVGNAAALLLKKASCREVYSPLASEVAARSLKELGIGYHFDRIVPHILVPEGSDICPMEKLSMGKDPEEFYWEVTNIKE